MDVLMVTAFVSLLLVVGGVVLYITRLRDGDFEHGDRLSLLPLGDDEGGDADDPVKEETTPPTTGGSA